MQAVNMAEEVNQKARQVCGNIKNAAVAFTVIKVIFALSKQVVAAPFKPWSSTENLNLA